MTLGKLESENSRQGMTGLIAGIDQWKLRHANAWLHPEGIEVPLVTMIKGWLGYADEHQKAYESGIGEDYVLGDEWCAIGVSLRALLNGDFGRRLDGGSLDRVLCDALTVEGWDCDLNQRA